MGRQRTTTTIRSNRSTTEKSTDRLMLYGEHLTPRELEVLFYFATGITTRGIAYKMGIHERGVNFHKGQIMLKSNTSGMVQAMCYYGSWTLHEKYKVVRDNRGLNGYTVDKTEDKLIMKNCLTTKSK